MSPPKGRRQAGTDDLKEGNASMASVPAAQLLRLQKRELEVLNAFSRLPEECRAPSAAVLGILRQGVDIPHSSLAQILRRLERRGVIRLPRKRP